MPIIVETALTENAKMLSRKQAELAMLIVDNDDDYHKSDYYTFCLEVVEDQITVAKANGEYAYTEYATFAEAMAAT